MAATLTRERFAGPEWVFERKLDGIRLLAFKAGSEVRLPSRNQLPQNASYPSFVLALERLLDGRDLTSLTLDVRRELLECLPVTPPLELVSPLDDPEPWERACREGWEGVVQVAFKEWTRHGKLRHPRLVGVRLDKAARSVVRELP